MRYRITATYAGAVDPLAEDEVAQLVGWWTRRAPAHAPTGALRDRRAVEIALQADGQNPLDVLFRLSAPLAVPHGPFRLVAVYVVDAAWEEDPPAGVSVSRRARPRLRRPASTAPLLSATGETPLPSPSGPRGRSATGTLPSGHRRSGHRPP
jgi:hypothetical protein